MEKMTTKKYQEVMTEMKKARKVKHFTKKDVLAILKARKSGDWKAVHDSKLYIEYGGEYCSLLEVINELF